MATNPTQLQRAWTKLHTSGSSASRKNLHANMMKRGDAVGSAYKDFISKNPDLDPTQGASVKQATKSVVADKMKVAAREKLASKAYGATKGTKVGGEFGGSGEIRDTVVPLSKDQRSVAQTAERAAKAPAPKLLAKKPAKPLDAPLAPKAKSAMTAAERISAIAKAVKKSKSVSRFDVPTTNPDDVDHDDLMDVHHSLHIPSKKSFDESKEPRQAKKVGMYEAFVIHKGKHVPGETSSLAGQTHYGVTIKDVYDDKIEAQKHADELNRGRGYKPEDIKNKAFASALYQVSPKSTKKVPGVPLSTWFKINEKRKVNQIDEQNDTTEKTEMAENQLHFIKYAADEILEFISKGGEIEEWYQNKLSKTHSDIESLHSYVEGEMRRTGMKEEVEQVDEITITNVIPPRGLPGKSSAEMGKAERDAAKKFNAENPPGKFDKEAHMKKVLANMKKEEVEQDVTEGAPELLKKEMPLHRHAEKLLAQNGVRKDGPDYHKHLGNTIKHLRKFGNIDLINKQGGDKKVKLGEQTAKKVYEYEPEGKNPFTGKPRDILTKAGHRFVGMTTHPKLGKGTGVYQVNDEKDPEHGNFYTNARRKETTYHPTAKEAAKAYHEKRKELVAEAMAKVSTKNARLVNKKLKMDNVVNTDPQLNDTPIEKQNRNKYAQKVVGE